MIPFFACGTLRRAAPGKSPSRPSRTRRPSSAARNPLFDHQNKVFDFYIDVELQLGNVDRCRALYERFLEWAPHNCGAWIKFAELERSLGETDRARAIFELAISQPLLDMPEKARERAGLRTLFSSLACCIRRRLCVLLVAVSFGPGLADAQQHRSPRRSCGRLSSTRRSRTASASAPGRSTSGSSTAPSTSRRAAVVMRRCWETPWAPGAPACV